MATAESLAHELRSRGWSAFATCDDVADEGGDTSGGWVCEIDDDEQHQPVDVNVYHRGPNGHIWQAGRTTYEVPEDIGTSELADRVIESIRGQT
ncbi:MULTISPECIES: hypothetical protein [unclassified Mycobacterium]|uniref:hypothetical protein n=1 Tax=unclassified Mycobacterium TaxID=2642494 RepID=UPI00082BC16F|nr:MULTISPECIES: hypothetical protein [unclassified Mycobacterium]